MPLLTTTVGAYPKPITLFTPDRRQSHLASAQSVEAERLLDRAMRQVVAEQVEAGIEIPTTGQVRRHNGPDYVCRYLAGIDFSRLTAKKGRLDSAERDAPTVTGPLALADRFLRREWRVAQAATKRPVKITLPGPQVLADFLADDYYGDDRRLCAALAEALNQEIREVAEAGCGWIQIDEPLFALDPEHAVAFGIDNVERCFHRVPAGVVRVVHLCSGYPAEVDEEDYLKAEAEGYVELAEPLELSSLGAVSIEDTHRPLDLSLLEEFVSTSVILGIVAGASSQIEPVEELTDRLNAALDHIDSDRLIAAPDGALHLLDRRLAFDKLKTLVTAAHAVG